MRFCVDYHRLNVAMVNDAYPLPRIDDSLVFHNGLGQRILAGDHVTGC